MSRDRLWLVLAVLLPAFAAAIASLPTGVAVEVRINSFAASLDFQWPKAFSTADLTSAISTSP